MFVLALLVLIFEFVIPSPGAGRIFSKYLDRLGGIWNLEHLMFRKCVSMKQQFLEHEVFYKIWCF